MPPDNKDFWLEIGIKLGQVLSMKEDFEHFKDNDFVHLRGVVDCLVKKVTKISVKVAWIVGLISGASLLVHVLFIFIRR